LDSYCDGDAHLCKPELGLTNAAIGRFSCTLVDSTAIALGQSEIIARVDRDGDGEIGISERWSFPNIASCAVLDSGQVFILFKAWGPTAGLVLSFDGATALKSRASLLPASAPYADDSLMLQDYENQRAWAYALSGSVMLAGNLRLGGEIQGYLAAALPPVQRYLDQVAYGIPCVDGVGTCGASLQQWCSTLDSFPVCTTTCGSDYECSLGGASCVSGIAQDPACLRRCTSDADCATPLECKVAGGTKVCI
jgi:hypothetical protein